MLTRSKNKVIILYGPAAVGKLTIGKLLAKDLRYKLSHNHLINDLVYSVFKRGLKESVELVDKMRYEFYERAASSGYDLIITHCYSNNYISPSGLSDPVYLKILERRLEKVGAKVFCIHLQADLKVLLTRVKDSSRKKFKKITKVGEMKKYARARDLTTSAPVKRNLVINNTKLSPKAVSKIVQKYIKDKKS